MKNSTKQNFISHSFETIHLLICSICFIHVLWSNSQNSHKILFFRQILSYIAGSHFNIKVKHYFSEICFKNKLYFFHIFSPIFKLSFSQAFLFYCSFSSNEIVLLYLSLILHCLLCSTCHFMAQLSGCQVFLSKKNPY